MKNEISLNGIRFNEAELMEEFQDLCLLQSALAELLSCVESLPPDYSDGHDCPAGNITD